MPSTSAREKKKRRRRSHGRRRAAQQADHSRAEAKEGLEEELVDMSTGNDVVSWVRKYVDTGDQKVRFDEVVKVRHYLRLTKTLLLNRGKLLRTNLSKQRRGRYGEKN